jgi:hypothetical protein
MQAMSHLSDSIFSTPNDNDTESDVFNMTHNSSDLPSTMASTPITMFTVDGTADKQKLDGTDNNSTTSKSTTTFNNEDNSITINDTNNYDAQSDGGMLVFGNQSTVRTFYCFSHDEEEGHVDIVLDEAINLNKIASETKSSSDISTTDSNEIVVGETEQQAQVVLPDKVENDSSSLQTDDIQAEDTGTRNHNRPPIRSHSNRNMVRDQNKESVRINKKALEDGNVMNNGIYRRQNSNNSFEQIRSNHSYESYNHETYLRKQNEQKSRPPQPPQTRQNSHSDIRRLHKTDSPMRRRQQQQQQQLPEQDTYNTSIDIPPIMNRRIPDEYYRSNSNGRSGSNGRSNSNGRSGSNGRGGTNGRSDSNGPIGSHVRSGSNGRGMTNGQNNNSGHSRNSNGRSGSNGRNVSNGRSGSNGRDGRNNTNGRAEGNDRNSSNGRAGSNGRNSQMYATKTTRMKLDNVGRCNSAPHIVYDCTNNNVYDRKEQLQRNKHIHTSSRQPRSSTPKKDRYITYQQNVKEHNTQYHHARSHSASTGNENSINHVSYEQTRQRQGQNFRSHSPNDMTKDIWLPVNKSANTTYPKMQSSSRNDSWNSLRHDDQRLGLQEQMRHKALPNHCKSDIVVPANKHTINFDSSSDDDDDDESYTSEMCHSDDSRSLALSAYIEKKYKREDNELDQKYIPPLVMRAYHLPGYTWTEDWIQNMTNNHPVLGLCCHHPRHPIQGWTRVATLFGSILFGLAITNAVYLAFVFTNTDYNKTYFQLSNSGVGAGGVTVNSLLSVTNGNIALWTFGVTLHALYDNTIWSLAACACFMDHQKMKVTEKMKRYQRTGSYLAMLSVLFILALTTFVVIVRGSLDEDGDGQISLTEEKSLNGIFSTKDNNTDTSTTTAGSSASNWTVYDDDIFNSTFMKNNTTSVNNNNTTTIVSSYKQATRGHRYAFLVSYCIELVLSYTIFYPIIGTILFSGILTCGRYPVLGGRPYEIRQEEIAEEHKRVRMERQQKRYERDERRKRRIQLQNEAVIADNERRWMHDIEIATIGAVATTTTATIDNNSTTCNDDTNTISVIEISIPITSNQYGGYSCNKIT